MRKLQKMTVSLFTVLITLSFLWGCEKIQNESTSKTTQELEKNSSFVFNEELPYGTSWEDAIEYYGTNLDKLEEWEYSTGTSPFFQPEQTVKLYDMEWQQGVFFTSDMELMQGTYQCFMSNLDDVQKVVHDLYDTYGDGEMTREDFLGYLEDLSMARLSDYWVAEDGSSLMLLVLGTANQYTVSILYSESADGAFSGYEEISIPKPSN